MKNDRYDVPRHTTNRVPGKKNTKEGLAIDSYTPAMNLQGMIIKLINTPPVKNLTGKRGKLPVEREVNNLYSSGASSGQSTESASPQTEPGVPRHILQASWYKICTGCETDLKTSAMCSQRVKI